MLLLTNMRYEGSYTLNTHIYDGKGRTPNMFQVAKRTISFSDKGVYVQCLHVYLDRKRSQQQILKQKPKSVYKLRLLKAAL